MPSDTDDTDDTDGDEPEDTDDTTDETDPSARLQDCIGCSGSGMPVPLWLGLLALFGLRRRQERMR